MNREIVLEAAGDAVGYAAPVHAVLEDKRPSKFDVTAVKQKESSPAHAAPEHKVDREIVLEAACTSQILQTQHAAPEHKANPEIVIGAVKHSEKAQHAAT